MQTLTKNWLYPQTLWHYASFECIECIYEGIYASFECIECIKLIDCGVFWCFFNVTLLLFVNHSKDFLWFTDCLTIAITSMKLWSYKWLEFGWTFSTIIAIIRACACWALFVVTLTNTVHLIYIYIYLYVYRHMLGYWHSDTLYSLQAYACSCV